MHLRQHKRHYIKKSYASILSFLIVIFLLVQINFADTEVSGIISTDTTWTLAESPYIVTGDINVEEGVKLTIEPGITIKFDGNYYLRIGGELNAIGTEDGIITFTSSSQASIRWNTIKFCDSSVDAVFDENSFYQSGSIIQYSVIEYAGNSGIFIHGASPFINFCRIRNNSISRYTAYGGGGVSVVAYDGEVGAAAPIIKNCTIMNNQSYSSYSPSASAIGTRNSFAIITTNIISENIGGAGSISISGGSPIIKNNNIVSDNIAINWQFGYPQIMHNTIKGGIYCADTDQGIEKGKINYNNLDKYNSQYAISNNPQYGGAVDIDASNNWWGTTDTFVIDDLIYDYYDDFEEGKVNYIPILNSPDPDAPITLTISAVTGGTTTPLSGSYIYNVGTEVSITAIPDTDYRFSGWTGDVPEGHENDNPVTITIDGDKSITANFIRQYTLTIIAGTGGTTDPAPGSYDYDSGTLVSVTATASSGYQFSSWSGDASGTTNPITVTMDSDKSITANFKAIAPSEETKKKGGCFIATAAYGSSLHPHIDVLREFRDEHLMTNKFGRGLVKIYYRYSPSIARLIARNKALKITVRVALLPLVGLSFLTVH